MSLCELLGRPYFEVAQWPLHELKRWQIWARHRENERKAAEKKAKRSSKK